MYEHYDSRCVWVCSHKYKSLPVGVIDVNFSASSCVGDTLLLLPVLCGVNGGNELPCESMVARTAVDAVAATRVPQKLKSNLLPDKRASRSRRHFSLSMCTCEGKKTRNVFIIIILSRNVLIKLEIFWFGFDNNNIASEANQMHHMCADKTSEYFTFMHGA